MTLCAFYFDPSEDRPDSRVPRAVLQRGQALPGLEEATGADWLLTPFGETRPLRPLATPMGHDDLLFHVRSGAMLIQRKSGLDFLGSLEKLCNLTFARMEQWTQGGRGAPWLVTTGVVEENAAGQLVIDGQPTNYTYQAYHAATLAWQYRGGYLAHLWTDHRLGWWIDYWRHKLAELLENYDKIVHERIKLQQLHLTGADLTAQILAQLEGLGEKKARDLAEYAGSPAQAMMLISDPRAEELPNLPVSKNLLRKLRAQLGLAEGYGLVVVRHGDIERWETSDPFAPPWDPAPKRNTWKPPWAPAAQPTTPDTTDGGL